VSTSVRLAPAELVSLEPSLTGATEGRQQFLDLAGDGQLDLVQLSQPLAGFYEREGHDAWETFRPFTGQVTVNWSDPNLRLIDLPGDGHADVLLTDDDALTWFPSLAEDGFGPGETLPKALDEERGPSLVFADGTDSIFVADMSGDGLMDLVRVRNG